MSLQSLAEVSWPRYWARLVTRDGGFVEAVQMPAAMVPYGVVVLHERVFVLERQPTSGEKYCTYVEQSAWFCKRQADPKEGA